MLSTRKAPQHSIHYWHEWHEIMAQSQLLVYQLNRSFQLQAFKSRNDATDWLQKQWDIIMCLRSWGLVKEEEVDDEESDEEIDIGRVDQHEVMPDTQVIDN